MGDRCSVQLYCATKDVEAVLAKLVEIGFTDDSDRPGEHYGGQSYWEWEEVNYSGQENWEALTDEGLRFRVAHGAGDCYPEGEYIGMGGEILHMDTQEGCPFVRLDSNGNVGADDLVRSRRFIAERRRFEIYAEESKPEEPEVQGSDFLDAVRNWKREHEPEYKAKREQREAGAVSDQEYDDWLNEELEALRDLMLQVPE